MNNYELIENLLEELEPYQGATGSEPDELLYHLTEIARSYGSYILTDEFEQALIDELTAIKNNYQDNFEWHEETITHIGTAKTLVEKY